MPQTNSDKKLRKPAVPLRRSPRFIQIVLVDPEDPRTPNPEPRKRTPVPSSETPLRLTGKRKVSHRRSCLRSNSKESSQKPDESCNARQRCHSSKTRSRRSTELTLCTDEYNGEKSSRSSNGRNRELERRVTRSSCRDVDTNAKKIDYSGFTETAVHACSSGGNITQEAVNTPEKSKGKLPKNKVKNSKKSQEKTANRLDTLAFNDNTNEGVLAITEKPTLDEELSEKGVGKMGNGAEIATPSVVQMNKRMEIKKKQKNVGVKRKRNQLEGIEGVTHGWTKDQESALERAYLQAKPTPHFWKKVSRLVPGKSAQECFDKIHGSHLTPPPPRLRSRPRVLKSQSPPLSASKLLSSSSPTNKKPKSRKQKSHVIQRTVRHMLQNQYKQQDSEPDIFSVLEPKFTQSLNMLTTPVRNQDLNGILKRSSTAHKKSLSRFSGSHGSTLVSPPVLKQVKNKALHEKYIDQLNIREASRKAASGKLHKSEGLKGESSVQRKNAVKAAKNALVFGARDAINEFQYQQGTALIDIFEDEGVVGADEDCD